MSIGELAKRTGYSPAMIRYFEKLGVITPSARTAGGYRVFGPRQVRELQFVREMQNLGMKTKHIKILREIGSSEDSVCARGEAVEKVFQEHVRYVERKLADFTDLRARLRSAAPGFVDRVLGTHLQALDADDG